VIWTLLRDRSELAGAVGERLDPAARERVDHVEVGEQLVPVGVLAFQAADTDHDTTHADEGNVLLSLWPASIRARRWPPSRVIQDLDLEALGGLI
jgi:hypothetical protein